MNIRQETLSDIRHDILKSLQSYYNETETHKDNLSMNPDWESYETLEDSNLLKIFTCRDDLGNLLGYVTFVVVGSLHAKGHKFATSDSLFIEPEHRKSNLGYQLLSFAEKCLSEDGISLMLVIGKNHIPLGSLMGKLGFSPTETIYSKYIGD